MKNKTSLFLSFMTLIIRIPRYTYCKSQNHYQQKSTLVEFFEDILFSGTAQFTLFVYIKVENMKTFYMHIIFHAMDPFYHFLNFPLK